MTVNELIDIIKKEKLYEYQCFKIGSPENTENSIWTSADGFGYNTYGIVQESSIIWKSYTIDERNNTIYMNQNFTESTACENLLNDMRSRKSYCEKYNHPKLKYHIHNPEKWFNI